jgi:hypothetical protein
MNMVAPQGGGSSHLMGSPIQSGGLDTAGILGMVQRKMDGGRRRKSKRRQRGGMDMDISKLTDVLKGGRRTRRRSKGSKRRGSKRRGSKRRSYRK